MPAAATHEQTMSVDIAERRLLTEVEHLRGHMLPDGRVPDDVAQDVISNLETAVAEMAIPAAVFTSLQRVEYHTINNRQERLITWLGMSAVEVAQSGRNFYVSEAGHVRGDIEVAEAVYSQESLRVGRAQVMISPQMSPYDAPEAVAKAEHLYGQDAVRVSYPVTDKAGVIVARRMESLLVSDIPLAAWVAMLRDPANIFGIAFDIRNEHSATSVMELFMDLELPAAVLPDGPVTLVEEVMAYLQDPAAKVAVQRQIASFRSGQEIYRAVAEQTARKWYSFELALAHSLTAGQANADITGFIVGLQHHWNNDDLAIIARHDNESGYSMTTELAALLERAQRGLLAAQAAIASNNHQVMSQVDVAAVRMVQTELQSIEQMRAQQYDPREIAYREAQLNRIVAGYNLQVGGGCAGDVSANFKQANRTAGEYGSSEADDGSPENASAWSWKKGVCRVKLCPSPKPTEVGPCSVCRNCQHKFDQGQDPTAHADTVASREKVAARTGLLKFVIFNQPKTAISLY